VTVDDKTEFDDTDSRHPGKTETAARWRLAATLFTRQDSR
jgi:hypothetical protein